MRQLLKQSKFEKRAENQEKEMDHSIDTYSEIPVLSDSLRKKIDFVKSSVAPIKLPNISILPSKPIYEPQSNTALPIIQPNTNYRLKLSSAAPPINNNPPKLSNKMIPIKMKSSNAYNRSRQPSLTSFQINEFTSSTSSFSSTISSNENPNMMIDDFVDNFVSNSKEKFNDKFQNNQIKSQSSLLRKLKMSESDYTNKAEIFVRPIPSKKETTFYDEKGVHKNFNSFKTNLDPLVKNLRFDFIDLSSINKVIGKSNNDFNDFNEHTKNKNTLYKNLKPIKEKYRNTTNIKNENSNKLALKAIDIQKNFSTSNSNMQNNQFYDRVLKNNSAKIIKTPFIALSDNPDVNEEKYFDFSDLLKKNIPNFKSDDWRKRLSQINEESSYSSTPVTNTNWSSTSSYTTYEENDLFNDDLWSNSDCYYNSASTNTNGRLKLRNSRIKI